MSRLSTNISVYKTGNKKWMAQVLIGKDENGKRKYKRFSADKKLEATNKAKEYLKSIYGISSSKDILYAEDYFLYFLNNIKKPKLQNTSFDREKRTFVNQIIPFIGHHPLTELNPTILQEELFDVLYEKGYYDEMIQALNEAGFDPNKEEHWLICCGDYLDRGNKPGAVINYLRSLPRKILIKGNHDDMLMELFDRGIALSHDIQNGTVNTVYRLGYNPDGDWDSFLNIAHHIYAPFYNMMVDYFETKNYIFVHSWVPLIRQDTLPKHYARNRKWAFNEDWRNATEAEWQEARWPNPFETAKKGLRADKTIVCGHWNTSWPRAEYLGQSEFGDDAYFSPYYDDGIIGIDACTAYSGKVNVLILEDDFLISK